MAHSSARRIVHLGLGNFHRAHQAVYTADAGDAADWAVTGVAHRSAAVVDALRRQQMRYAVLTIADDDHSVRAVRVHDEALVAATDAAAVIERIADTATEIVSLTVTEKGYALRPDGGLDTGDRDVRHDLSGGAPRSTVGLLAAGLLRRDAPVTVLSCDNLTRNGEVVRRALSEFTDALGGTDGVQLQSVVDECAFPCTMVDRIVPATTDEHRDIARLAGIDDAVPVPAEPFSMWVLADDFVIGRPDWAATFSAEVDRYEAVKVRLLNGSHSLLAGLGLLTGLATIAAAIDRPAIDRAVTLLGDAYVPTLDLPAGLDVSAYRSALRDRFANHALAHSVRQVGTDTSLKLTQRLPAAVGWHHGHGLLPGILALPAAAWLQGQGRPGRLPEGATPPPDPAGERLRELGRTAGSGTALARAALTDEQLLGPVLGDFAAYVDRVGELLDVLDFSGVDAAVQAADAAP